MPLDSGVILGSANKSFFDPTRTFFWLNISSVCQTFADDKMAVAKEADGLRSEIRFQRMDLDEPAVYWTCWNLDMLNNFAV